jgi:hypothetical protein
MTKEFEVRWKGVLPATSQEVWDAFTRHTAGFLWKIDYRAALALSDNEAEQEFLA